MEHWHELGNFFTAAIKNSCSENRAASASVLLN